MSTTSSMEDVLIILRRLEEKMDTLLARVDSVEEQFSTLSDKEPPTWIEQIQEHYEDRFNYHEIGKYTLRLMTSMADITITHNPSDDTYTIDGHRMVAGIGRTGGIQTYRWREQKVRSLDSVYITIG